MSGIVVYAHKLFTSDGVAYDNVTIFVIRRAKFEGYVAVCPDIEICTSYCHRFMLVCAEERFSLLMEILHRLTVLILEIGIAFPIS